MKGLGLEIENLENPMYVIGTRVSFDQICRDCELEISRILLTMDLRSWTCQSLMSSLGRTGLRHIKSSLIVIVGGLLPTHWMVFVLCFKGDKHDALLRALYDLRWHV